MTPNFESALKKAWKEMASQCPDDCSAWEKGTHLCEGHAALLKMVRGYHIKGCECCDIGGGNKLEDLDCRIERRRLRAAVGVDK